MNIVRVLTEAGYPAIGRVAGVDPIRNLPCPVVPHKNQTNNSGPAMVYPPGHDGPNDPGTLTCRNCDESWGAVKLAETLSVSSEVVDGRERYVPPRTPSSARRDAAPVEPIDIESTWVKAQATVPQSRLAFQYFKRRWRDDDLAESALSFVGWTSGFKQDYWKKHREHTLLVPLYDVHGSVVSGIRRFVGHGKTKFKSLRLSNEAVGLPSGTPVWLGDPPPAAANLCKSKVLYVAEGEIDTILLMCLREEGYIEGGILGSPGGAAGSPGWWDETAKLITEPPTSVVLVMDADTAGDKYWQRSANAFPNAQRVILPDYTDLTDCVSRFGTQEAITLLNSAARSHFGFYQLDSGRFAYLAGGQWYDASGRSSLTSRLRGAGYDQEEAQAISSALPSARDIVFNPNSTQPVVIERGNTWLNQFRGLHLEPAEGDCNIYKWLLHWLCGEDPESFEYCLDWIAKPLQGLYQGKGATRNKTALIYYGTQGTGKGFFWGPDGIMKALYGKMMTEVMQTQMEDRFDPGTLTRALLVIANEVACSGYRDAKTLNKLKAWITEPTIMVRRMHKAGEEYPIWFNMVLMSNDDMPIRLEPGDRRYNVFRQDKKLEPGVIKTLVTERNNGWPGARHFLSYLLERDIVRDLATPFVNDARNLLLDASKPSQIQFAEMLVDLGLQAIMKDWEQAHGDRRQGPFTDATFGFMSGEHLHEVYAFWCKQVGVNYPVRWQHLKEAILKVVPEASATSGHRLGNTKKRGILGLPMSSKKNLSVIG